MAQSLMEARCTTSRNQYPRPRQINGISPEERLISVSGVSHLLIQLLLRFPLFLLN